CFCGTCLMGCGLDYYVAIPGAARLVSREPCESQSRTIHASSYLSCAFLPSVTRMSRTYSAPGNSTRPYQDSRCKTDQLRPCRSASYECRSCRPSTSKTLHRFSRTYLRFCTSPELAGIRHPCKPPNRTERAPSVEDRL